MKKKDRKKKRKIIAREQKKRAREWKIKRVRDAMFRDKQISTLRLHINSIAPSSSFLQVNFPKHYPAILLYDTIIESMEKEMARMAIIKCD